MIGHKFIDNFEKARHWRYYLMLEEDFERALRYVEPDLANESTFSLEFARQLQSICSQFETIARLICIRDEPGFNRSMKEISEGLLERVPGLFQEQAYFLGTHPIVPFSEWKVPTSHLSWWTAYTALKRCANRCHPFV